MEKDSTRLHSLDGLRGLAMLFVFFNHLTPKYLIATFPFLDKIGLFSSGVTGVSFFFILSGFLMSYLYPQPQDKFQFLQKRYTRIFPLFLTMCGIMLMFVLYPTIPWFFQIAIILLLASLVHIIWVYGIKKIPFQSFSRLLFFTFLFLQIVVGSFYLFWIMKQPPIVFQQFPAFSRNATVGLVNATLTFPLGNYIPMLDGVYWSLAGEILFYILYPFFIVPLVLFLIPQKRIVKIIFLFTLLPLIGGIDILSHHLFELSAFQFTLFYYFAGGILLGYLYRKKPQIFSVFSRAFKGLFSLVPIALLILTLIGEHFLNASLPNVYAPWIRLFSMFPFIFLVAIAINKETMLYKFLSTKILVFIGTISYSLYLSHSAVIHMAENTHRSGSLHEDIYTIIITFFVSIGISSLLYVLLEKPYFHRIKEKIISKNSLSSKTVTFLSGKVVLAGSITLYILAIFLSFQSQFNLFSFVVSHNTTVFLSSPTTNTVSLQQNSKITLKIPALENNLGIILISVAHHNLTYQTKNTPSLVFTLQQEGSNKPIITVPYVLDEFREEDFPFGFPIIADSKGKNYIATFALIPPSKSNYATFDTRSVKTVYQLDKKMLLKNPQTAITLGISKLQNVFANQLSTITFLLLLPFFVLSMYLILTRVKYTP